MPPQKTQRPHSKKRSQDTRPYHCTICNRGRHSRRTCASKPTTTTTRITITTTTTSGRRRKHCSNCDRPGHQWQTCTNPPKPASAASDGDDGDDDEDSDDDSDGDVSDVGNSERATAVTSVPKKPPSRPRGKLLSADEKMGALRVYLECMEEKKRGPTISTHNPLERASRYIDVSKPVLQRLHRFWSATGEIEPTLTRRGKHIRQKHECWGRHWLTFIREAVRALNRDGMPTTINTIMAKLDLENEHGIVMSGRTLNRVLLEIGFNYQDVSKAKQNYVETESIKRQRAAYLRERKRIRDEEPDTIEIWLDESYCNQNHAAGRSWFGEKDVVRRASGKGPRWMILHAGGAECGWVGEPLVEQAKNTSDGDYHKNMDSEMFLDYFRKLCEWMKERFGGRKVVFHMDNASYHKRIADLEEGETLSGLRKERLVKWLRKQGAYDNEICFYVQDRKRLGKLMRKEKTRDELYRLAQEKYPGTSITETIAKEHGYDVLFVPPYHPMLNPIEEAWGVTKGFVAYNNNQRSFSAVRTLIFGGFNKVTKEMWQKLVRRTHANEDAIIAERGIPPITTEDMNEMDEMMMAPVENDDGAYDDDGESVVVEITVPIRRTNDRDREKEGGGDDGGRDDYGEGPSRTWREKGKWKIDDVPAVNAADPNGDDRYGLASLEYEDIFEDLDVTLELTE